MTYAEKLVEALNAVLLTATITADHLKMLAQTEEQKASIRDLRHHVKEATVVMQEIDAVFTGTKKEYEIIINGTKVTLKQSVVGFEEIVMLASASKYASITYHRAPTPKTEGILFVGQTIRIQNGTIFDVANTGNA